MPKRPRQSHIPAQVRRRKSKRTPDFSSALPGTATAGGDEDRAAVVEGSVPAPRMGRRLAAATRTREGGVNRITAGQLPTFERSYLVRELTQIAVVSGGLLALILVLWVVMR